MPNSSLEVSRFIIARAKSKNIQVCNLKLQKLLYYAQGYHLACTDKPLFAGPIEAWRHGPVTPFVYQEYKICGSGQIPAQFIGDKISLNIFEQEIVDHVLDSFGHLTGLELRHQTHTESPWLNHSHDGKTADSKEITHEELMEYFKPLATLEGFSVKEYIDSAERMASGDFIALPDHIDSEDKFVEWAKALSV